MRRPKSASQRKLTPCYTSLSSYEGREPNSTLAVRTGAVDCQLPAQPQPRAQGGASMPHWGVLRPRLGARGGSVSAHPHPQTRSSPWENSCFSSREFPTARPQHIVQHLLIGCGVVTKPDLMPEAEAAARALLGKCHSGCGAPVTQRCREPGEPQRRCEFVLLDARLTNNCRL